MPRGNLSTIVVPVALDAYLHVVMADLTAHDLRLDRLFIYLYGMLGSLRGQYDAV